MKNLFLTLLFVGGVAALTSCKKDYTCTYDLLGTDVVLEYEGLDKDEAEAAESACKVVGGTWAKK
jgi:hypothetical protein